MTQSRFSQSLQLSTLSRYYQINRFLCVRCVLCGEIFLGNHETISFLSSSCLSIPSLFSQPRPPRQPALAHRPSCCCTATGSAPAGKYVTPIAYFYSDGFYFLVGSNWGKQQNAGCTITCWAQPRTTIEVKGRTTVRSRAHPGPKGLIMTSYGLCYPAPPALSAIMKENDQPGTSRS